MTSEELSEMLEAIIVEHKPNNVTSVEAKQALVVVAKEWMSKSDVRGMDEKFNTWNSEMAHLVVKHNITGAKT